MPTSSPKRCSNSKAELANEPLDWGNPKHTDMPLSTAHDQLRTQLECTQLLKRVTATLINVGAAINVCNRPDGSGWYISPTRLTDAFVIDVPTYRAVVALAFGETQKFGTDPMPPHCELIRALHGFAGTSNPAVLTEGEIILMIQHDGLITSDPHSEDSLLIAAAIGYYTMPIYRETAARINKTKKFDVAQVDDGCVRVSQKKLKFMEMGNFQRHALTEVEARGLREEKVAKKHEQMMAGNRSRCEKEVLLNPLVRGFLQEGAAWIARQVQLETLSEEVKRFYPLGVPSAQEEYNARIRSATEIFADNAFRWKTAGRPSACCLATYQRSTIRGCPTTRAESTKIWRWSIQWPLPITISWMPALRLRMSTDKPNPDHLASGDVPDEWFATIEREKRVKVRDELCRSMTGNLRRQGSKIPEGDIAGHRAQFVAKRLNMVTAGWTRIDRVREYNNGDGFLGEYSRKVRSAQKEGWTYNGELTPRANRAWSVDQNDVRRSSSRATRTGASAWCR
jgi:hypothetical protein